MFSATSCLKPVGPVRRGLNGRSLGTDLRRAVTRLPRVARLGTGGLGRMSTGPERRVTARSGVVDIDAREVVERAEIFVAAMRAEFMPEDSDVETSESSHE